MHQLAMYVAAIVIAECFLLPTAHSHSVEMGACRMVCDDVPFHGSSMPSLVGAPGKKGPPGIKGEKGAEGSRGLKGQQATPCLCPEHNALQEEINALKSVIKRVNAPEDCYDVVERNEAYRGGVYTIYPYSLKENGEEVYCDTKTDSGGWIVFQRRMDGSEDFFRGWDDYVNGFGDLNGEFWLGLNKMHNLMKTGRYELRVDLEDFENNTTYAKYSTFELGGADTFFAITTSGYSGTAGNCLQLKNVPFSTKDQDHDTSATSSCAQSYKGGSWYTSCHCSNLNGLYLSGPHESYANSVIWSAWKGQYYSLKFSEMKMRRKAD